MRTVLLTGFEPFDGESINPSWAAAKKLDGERIGNARVHARLLPCRFGESLRVLRKEIRTLKPDITICVGQAGGRSAITPERIAINVDDARIADNAGLRLADVPILRGGPAAYWSTLPIKAIVAALAKAKIRAAVSATAGTFVCNHVFYGLMHTLARSRRRPRPRGGFIHLPYLPEQVTEKDRVPSLSLKKMIAALRVAVAVSLNRPRDARVASGATH
jgi:pyroglutamyl-peptidase